MRPHANPALRPHLVLRFFAASAVILLAISYGVPVTAVAAFLGLLVGSSFGSGPLTESMFYTVLLTIFAFAAFVIGAFLLCLILNLATARSRSSLKWLAFSWALAAPAVVGVSGVAVGPAGPRLGAALWFSFACSLVGAWLAFTSARALWAWGQRSTFGATMIATAALLLVVIPGVVLVELPSFLERVNRFKDAQPPVHELFAHSSTPPRPETGTRTTSVWQTKEAETTPGDSAEACFAKLTGEPCDDVWHRTREALGSHHPDTSDALQAAYIYVCFQKTYTPPRLCGAFRKKAERLKIDAWRYTRKFRDLPAPREPVCSVPSAEDQALTQEELDVLDDARTHLDERSRRILDLAYREDLTDAVIGERLELSTGRVRVLRRGAEKQLAAFLERCQ